MNGIYKVVNQGQAFTKASQKTEGGQLKMCYITLQELGSKYANEYVATLLGNIADCRFFEGELVAASLRFSVRQNTGGVFQDVYVNEIKKIK